MRVDLTSSSLGQTGGAGSARADRSARASSEADEPAAASLAVDRAQFSYDQTSIRSLAAQALAAPEIRQIKVSSLAQSVGNGSYTVDAGKVAGALVAAYGGGAL
jgi:flagellar biosynthesis anti-sigma factor FlgM